MYQSIRDALYDGLEAVVASAGLTTPIIFSHGVGQEPQGTYIIINILTIEQQGGVVDSVGIYPTPSGFQSSFQSFHKVNVQFSVFGSDSGNVSTAIHNLINNYTENRVVFTRLGLSPLSKSQIRYNPQRRDTQWVDSFNFDMGFSFRIHDKKSVQWMDKTGFNLNTP